MGPAVAYHVSETMHEAYPDRFYVSANLKKIVEAGKTAIWTYDSGTPEIDPEVAELFEQVTPPLSEEQVRDRALTALAQETQLMLDEGVVAEAQDIDLCMLLGAGLALPPRRDHPVSRPLRCEREGQRQALPARRVASLP